jgi:hypothetical protein
MPIDETLPNIKTKEKHPPKGGKGGTKREDRCPTKRQHSSVQKAQHTGQEHKSYLCPKPLTGGIKQI